MATPQKSPHETCTAHSGLSGRMNLVLVLLLAGVGLQAYAVNLNTDTRIKMADFTASMEIELKSLRFEVKSEMDGLKKRVSSLEKQHKNSIASNYDESLESE